jgi:hypothetical protein
MSNFPLSGPPSELVNEPNAHFSNPGFSSKVGAVTGCGGSGSELALQQKGLYQVKQTAGKRMKKRGSKKRSSKKRSSKKRGSKKHRVALHRGGYGHAFAENQPDDMPGKATYTSYASLGQNSDTNMEASKQHNLSGGMKRKTHRKRSSYKNKKSRKMSNKKRGRSGKRGRSYGRKQRGGYSQYMSNVPSSHGYSVGGELSAKNSELANPPPFTPYNHCDK